MSKQLMTTDLNALTNRELLLKIVEAERDCAHIFSVRQGLKPASACQFCDGTGKVPILSPELMRLPCPCPKKVWHQETSEGGSWWDQPCNPRCYPNKHIEGCFCQGRSWIPNPDPWAMKRALRLAGFYLTEDSVPNTSDNKPWAVVCWVSEQFTDSGTGWVWDADPARARFLAVLKAFGAGGP